MELGVCERCGLSAPTRSVSLYQNTGMLVMRKTRTVSGHLCRKCISEVATSYTLHNLVLGWWGVISFISNPFYIANNLVYGMLGRGLEAPSAQAAPPQLSDPELALIEPYVEAMIARLEKGKEVADVAKEFAPQIGIEPSKIWLYLQVLMRQAGS